jgi:hypothetical protein
MVAPFGGLASQRRHCFRFRRLRRDLLGTGKGRLAPPFFVSISILSGWIFHYATVLEVLCC